VFKRHGVIILEGPDGSGKSAVARALTRWIGPSDCQVIKSQAGKDKTWSLGYKTWAKDHLEKSRESGKIMILDRTPEISELIYGSIFRDEVRLYDPFKFLSSLNHPEILIIMCAPHIIPMRLEHIDPMGNSISTAWREVEGAYSVLTSLMMGSHNIYKWDYEEMKPEWLSHFILRYLEIPGVTRLIEEDFR